MSSSTNESLIEKKLVSQLSQLVSDDEDSGGEHLR
jgi:hypothetical protein